MKKIFTTVAVLVAVISSSFVLTSWNNDDQSQMSSGAPAGYAGDPGNSSKDCSNGGCHTDFPSTPQAGMITSDIPVQGYTPNTTYVITATIANAPTIVRFGFENSAQNATGTADLGTLTPIGATETQIKTGTFNSVVHKYITHKSTSNSGTGSRTWTYNWTSPATGMGPVTFYGAFNEADDSGDDTGDNIFTSTLTVGEYFLGVDQPTSEQDINIYPTVSNGTFTIKNGAQDVSYDLSIYNVAGEKVFGKTINSNIETLNLNVPSGMYFVYLQNGNKTTLKKIIVQ